MSTFAVDAVNGLLHGNSEADTAPHNGATVIAAEAVREQLSRIVGSSAFPATDRSRRLLEYLVGEVLEGRGGRIKAYCIGTIVFGRPESFDPQKDPIVRIEAARLRREIEHYYLTAGREDPILIDIPKGAYVPHFSEREPVSQPASAVEGTAAGGTGWRVPSGLVFVGLVVVLLGLLAFAMVTPVRHDAQPGRVQIPGLLVKPIADLTRTDETAILAQGLTERIIEKTSRFKELAVIPGDGSAGQISTAAARYEFGGSLRESGDQILVQVRLVDRTDGRVIWANGYEVSLRPQQLFDVERAIADQIATKVAEPSGIVFEAERRMWLESPPDSLGAYLCTLSAYVYRTTFAAGKFPAMRACLEQAVADHPDYATAWALLSLADIDEYRFFYDPPHPNVPPPLDRAYEAARRATELDPTNVRGQQALMMALFFRQQYREALDVGAKAMELNPNDLELKGDYGYRLALTGNWADGCRLVQQSVDSSDRKIPYLDTVLALCHFFGDDLTTAASLISQAGVEENPAYHVIAAAIMAESGDAAAARQHREWLEQNAPRQLTELLQALPGRLVRPADRQRFLDALHKAGFGPAG